MKKERFNPQKEIKLKLSQHSVKADLYIAFDRFKATATEEEYELWRQKQHKNATNKDELNRTRCVKLYVLELEKPTSKWFKRYPVVKSRTEVGGEFLKDNKVRDEFLKGMLSIKKGQPFEHTEYYDAWKEERYIDCKIDETIQELAEMPSLI